MFGISSALEQYQNVISQVFHGIDSVENISDDTGVHRATKHEHDERLNKVFCRLHEKGLTLKKPKCKYGLNQIQFKDHMISDKGMGPTEKRVKSLLNASEPQNASEIRSFLALVNFSARYIPDLATINESLRKLTF